jgi:HSP20 family protein
MMSDPQARRQSQWLPELAELFTDLPTWADIPWLADTQLMRLEDEMEDGRYVVRAEIPGVGDPAKDIDIMVRDGQLTIKAERTEKKETRGRSEFRYGSFVRSVTLPESVSEDDIKATYKDGILTVSVPAAEPATSAEKHIVVQAANRAEGKPHRRHWRRSR